ncbi:MAG: hypothetical protein R3E86_19845 [Pseudomonadales bacterium]
MSDEFSPIRPKKVPLTHARETLARASAKPASSRLTLAMLALLIGALLALVFFVIPDWLARSGVQNSPATVTHPEAAAAPGAGGPGSAAAVRSGKADPGLPPYQQVLREQARADAQAELARFVELQLQLEQQMTVGAWGADEYERAKSLAAAGDEAFVREQFEPALAGYRDATAALQALIERGRQILEQAVADGSAALTDRDARTAADRFALAATIAPSDPRVQDGQARAALLPQINERLREARNLELVEDWQHALAVYEEISQMDPLTSGLAEGRERARQGVRQGRIQALLSEGFTALDAHRFDPARSAFRAVLELDADNSVARGALQQLEKDAVVARIAALQARAASAAAEERWDDALSAYEDVLAVDGNIQFAVAGRAAAREQQRLSASLGNILKNPERLSSQQLYDEAGQLLAQASALTPRGPRLAQLITDVEGVLQAYAQPVAVVLRSDARTEVTLSSVGPLGSFTEKRLQLRPGAYTLIGSQDGCRDVREQILVRPNMAPIDIRCTEPL